MIFMQVKDAVRFPEIICVHPRFQICFAAPAVVLKVLERGRGWRNVRPWKCSSIVREAKAEHAQLTNEFGGSAPSNTWETTAESGRAKNKFGATANFANILAPRIIAHLDANRWRPILKPRVPEIPFCSLQGRS